MMNPYQIIKTNDGSHTIYVPGLKEQYHSIHGAVQESKHIYINAGFNTIKKNSVGVLELGFGTGLNAFLTCIDAVSNGVITNYDSWELFPLPKQVYERLNYPELSGYKKYGFLYEQICGVEWNRKEIINDFFNINKINADIRNITQVNSYDLVYFDAFAPNVQPELWDIDVLHKVAESMKKNAVLVTFCSKSIVVDKMKKCDLFVEKLPGPPGKREFIRAIKR